MTFPTEPDKTTKIKIREAGLRWNRFRKEWQGYVLKVNLEKILNGIDHEIVTVKSQALEREG